MSCGPVRKPSSSYWREVATEINKIIGVDLDYSFIVLYINIPETVLQKDKYLLKILLACCRKAVGNLKMVASRPPNTGPVAWDH